MNVIKLDPTKRFSVTSFPKPFERFFDTQSKVADPTIYEQIIYKCGNCKNEIEFLEKHFKKHSKSRFTNLKDEHKKLILEFLKDNDLKQNSFLDFYCPGCNKPVSVQFSDGYGGRHGEYFVDIIFILEIVGF